MFSKTSKGDEDRTYASSDIFLGDEEMDRDEQVTDDAESVNVTKNKRIRSKLLKIITGVLIVGFIACIIIDSLTTKKSQSLLNSFLEWVGEHPIAGIFVFTYVYFIATIFFIPGLILTFGAGFVFADAFGFGVGIVIGTITVFVGATMGAIAAFVIGRYLLRDAVKNKLTKKYGIFEALDNSWQDKGFRIMSLFRLSPIIPFNAINYIAGVTSMSFRDYFLSIFFVLPGTVLYVFLGASAKTLTDSASGNEDPTLRIVMLVLGAVFGVAAVAMASYYAKKELNKISHRLESTTNQEDQDIEAAAVDVEVLSCDDSNDGQEVRVETAMEEIDLSCEGSLDKEEDCKK